MTNAIDWGQGVLIVQASICAFDLVAVFFSMYICYDLITPSVLTQSMNDIINYLLLIPIAGCGFLCWYLWWLNDASLAYSWLPELFLACAVSQVVVLPLGVFAGRMKSRTLLAA